MPKIIEDSEDRIPSFGPSKAVGGCPFFAARGRQVHTMKVYRV